MVVFLVLGVFGMVDEFQIFTSSFFVVQSRFASRESRVKQLITHNLNDTAGGRRGKIASGYCDEKTTTAPCCIAKHSVSAIESSFVYNIESLPFI